MPVNYLPRILPEKYQQKFLQAGNYPAMQELARKGPIPLRALVAAPVWALRSDKCIGSGELPELVELARWARGAGFSGILTLPLTSISDYDSSDSPYNSDSLRGNDPARVRLSEVREVMRSGKARALLASSADTISRLNSTERVDHLGTRQLKEAVLRAAFEEFGQGDKLEEGRRREFEAYCRDNTDWLEEHASFRLLVEKHKGRYWRDWPPEFQDPNSKEVRDYLAMPQVQREIKFQKFVQWLTDEQLKKYAKECAALGMPLFGDLIFAPSRQSAEFYYHRNYYLHGVSVGSRPDIFATGGQNWGLPAVDHRQFEADPSFLLRPAVLMRQRGFGGLRVDHGIGRVNPWLIRDGQGPLDGYRQFQGMPAEFINFGRNFFLGVMGTGLELFSENLGDSLPYLPPLMDELGIGEMGVFRWERKDLYDFIVPDKYDPLRAMCSSTHDTTTLAEHLANLRDPERACYANGEPYPPKEIGKLKDEAAALVRYLHWNDLYQDDVYRDVMRSLAFGPTHQVIFPLADVMASHGAYRDQRKWMPNRPGTVNSPKYPYNWNWVAPDLHELFARMTARALFISNYSWDLMFGSGRAPL